MSREAADAILTNAMTSLKLYLELARPHQYIKNGFVWLPIFFGYKLSDWQALHQTALAFLVFCLAASSVYVLNDLWDMAEDRQHPVKRHRPLASGELRPAQAVRFLALLLAGAGILAGAFLPTSCLVILGSYLALNLAYSLFLKHFAVVDVVCIALGFVLRVYAGGVAAAVPVSHWIVALTFLLALFLALGKRRDDLILAADGHGARKSLDGYNLEFVGLSMGVMAAVIIVAYLLYTVSPDTIRKHGTDQLYLTAFWVIVGLLRYFQITLVEGRSGSPTKIFLNDHFLQIVMLLWLLSFFVLHYLSRFA
ncbi:MAG: decaprenyl-phosphate phosphoribosyltransferase [Desulfobaccales bacterium]